jgi:hypothetical protein
LKIGQRGRCEGGLQNKNGKETGEEKQDEGEHMICGK